MAVRMAFDLTLRLAIQRPRSARRLTTVTWRAIGWAARRTIEIVELGQQIIFRSGRTNEWAGRAGPWSSFWSWTLPTTGAAWQWSMYGTEHLTGVALGSSSAGIVSLRPENLGQSRVLTCQQFAHVSRGRRTIVNAPLWRSGKQFGDRLFDELSSFNQSVGIHWLAGLAASFGQ